MAPLKRPALGGPRPRLARLPAAAAAPRLVVVALAPVPHCAAAQTSATPAAALRRSRAPPKNRGHRRSRRRPRAALPRAGRGAGSRRTAQARRCDGWLVGRWPRPQPPSTQAPCGVGAGRSTASPRGRRAPLRPAPLISLQPSPA
eukprot:363762-Chlamydomonas_euryale.AAC.2